MGYDYGCGGLAWWTVPAPSPEIAPRFRPLPGGEVNHALSLGRGRDPSRRRWGGEGESRQARTDSSRRRVDQRRVGGAPRRLARWGRDGLAVDRRRRVARAVDRQDLVGRRVAGEVEPAPTAMDVDPALIVQPLGAGAHEDVVRPFR